MYSFYVLIEVVGTVLHSHVCSGQTKHSVVTWQGTEQMWNTYITVS